MTDFSTPEAADEAFYLAFQTADTGLMQEVWWPGPDSVCIHPGSASLQGDEIQASWQAIFAGSEDPELEPGLRSCLMASQDQAVFLVTEHVGDAADPIVVAATNAYRFEEGRWWMVLHHASVVVHGGEQAVPERVH